MSVLSDALVNLVDGRGFVLLSDDIADYPESLSINGSKPEKDILLAEIERIDTENVSKDITRQIRAAISSRAGDAESLLGTTADGVQLLLYGFSDLIVKLHSAKSVDEVNAAAEPFHALAVSFLNKVENGDVLLPFLTKGIDNVVSDIESRATVVAQELGKER